MRLILWLRHCACDSVRAVLRMGLVSLGRGHCLYLCLTFDVAQHEVMLHLCFELPQLARGGT